MSRRLTALRVGNFKAFADTQRIPLKPITLIFGPNSAGKSSFIHRYEPLGFSYPCWASARPRQADTQQLETWAKRIFTAKDLTDLLGPKPNSLPITALPSSDDPPADTAPAPAAVPAPGETSTPLHTRNPATRPRSPDNGPPCPARG